MKLDDKANTKAKTTPENVSSVEDNCVKPKLDSGLPMATSSSPTHTASNDASMQQLLNSNPGNQVPPKDQGDQKAADEVADEEILPHESNSDSDEKLDLSKLMKKLDKSGMSLIDRMELSKAISEAHKAGKLEEFAA
jgi:hypothetical protein